MRTRPKYLFKSVSTLFFFLVAIINSVAAQAKPGKVVPEDDSLFSSWTTWVGLAAVAGLVVAAVVMRRKAAEVIASTLGKAKKGGVTMTYRETKEAPKERKPKPPSLNLPRLPKKEGFAVFPVSTFTKVQKANSFIQLPESHEPALLEAIEQTHEDSEEDVQTRTHALKMLSTFKTSNSISAIAQIALYDLSSKLRSDAVQILADMNHETGFETIVTCCADPTREVRAAAARALFKLTFDRSHAWARIIESGDTARMCHVARCAMEGDLVERSFDRLIHSDRKIASEAFNLTSLLIKGGETELIYKALANHRDENVKLALLHVLQVVKDDRSFDSLSNLITHHDLSPNVATKVNEVRSSLQMTHA